MSSASLVASLSCSLQSNMDSPGHRLLRNMYECWVWCMIRTDRRQIQKSDAIVKRPAHYQSLSEGIDKGRALLVGSSLSPSPPERWDTARKRTLDWMDQCEDESTLDGSTSMGEPPSASPSPLPAYKQRRLSQKTSSQPPRIIRFPAFTLPSESRAATSERDDMSVRDGT